MKKIFILILLSACGETEMEYVINPGLYRAAATYTRDTMGNLEDTDQEYIGYWKITLKEYEVILGVVNTPMEMSGIKVGDYVWFTKEIQMPLCEEGGDVPFQRIFLKMYPGEDRESFKADYNFYLRSCTGQEWFIDSVHRGKLIVSEGEF